MCAGAGLLHHRKTDSDVCGGVQRSWHSCAGDPLSQESVPQVCPAQSSDVITYHQDVCVHPALQTASAALNAHLHCSVLPD